MRSSPVFLSGCEKKACRRSGKTCSDTWKKCPAHPRNQEPIRGGGSRTIRVYSTDSGQSSVRMMMGVERAFGSAWAQFW